MENRETSAKDQSLADLVFTVLVGLLLLPPIVGLLLWAILSEGLR